MVFWKKETQLDRIKNKLEKAMRKDTGFLVFGSSSHQYRVNEKLTECQAMKMRCYRCIKMPQTKKSN